MVVTVNYDSSELSVEIEDMLGGEYKIKVTGNGDVNGEKSITVKVSDGLSDPINRPVLLQIAAVNDAPTIGEIKKTSHQFGESYIERLEVGDVDTQISSLIVSIDPEVASFSISHLEGTEVFDLVGLDDLEATTHEVTVNVSDGFITSSVFARISIEKVLVVPVFVEPEKELIATEDEEFIYTIVVTDNTVSELTVELLNSPSWISNISSIVNVVGTRGEIRVVATPKNEHVTGEGVAGDKLIIKISDGSSEAIATYSITVVNTDDKVTINIEEVDFIGSEGESYSAIFSIEDIDRNNTVSASDIRIVVEGDWLTGSYDESSKLYTVTGVVETELADGVTESVDVSVEVTDRHAADLGIIHYSYEVEITGVNDLPEIEELEGLYNLIEDTGYEITFNVLDNDSPVSYTHLTLPTICSV